MDELEPPNNKTNTLKIFEETVRKRVESEEKAFQIVNKLIDETVENDYLVACCRFITPEHYDDIVEERSISYLCGYPVCKTQLKNIPKQKYHISTKSNRVFDISERKKFCSNQCLKASKVLKDQISVTPVWARERAHQQAIQLLSRQSTRGILGEEVVGKSIKSSLEEELAELKILDDKFKKSTKAKPVTNRKKRAENKEKGITNCPQETHNLTVENALLEELDKLQLESTESEVCDSLSKANLSLNSEKIESSDSDNLNIKENSPNLRGSQSESPVKEETRCSKRKDHITSHQINLVDKGQDKSETSSITKLDKLKMLMTKNKTVLFQMVELQNDLSKPSVKRSENLAVQPKNIFPPNESIGRPSISSITESALVENGLDKNVNSRSTSDFKNDNSIPTQSKSLNIQSALIFLSSVLESWVTDRTLNFVKINISTDGSRDLDSQYSSLCNYLDTEEFTESVISMNGQNKETQNKKSLPDYEFLKKEVEEYQSSALEFLTGKRVKEKPKEGEDIEDEIVLPTVDAYDQMQIRAKIVLDRIDKCLLETLSPLHLSIQDVSTEIKQLVHTFHLEKDSIVLKPSQWMLITILILKLLSYRNKQIEVGFALDSAKFYFDTLLGGIGHTMEDLNSAVYKMLFP